MLEENFVRGLLLSPAESAKRAINKSNPIWTKSCGHIKRHVSHIRAAEDDLKFANSFEKIFGYLSKQAIGYE